MTSDERREVAEGLRRTANDDLGGLSFQRSLAKESGASDESWRGVMCHLADLIDPTCHMEPEGEGFRCSACGTYHDMSGFEEFPWPRCPECGARVVRGDGR